MINADKLIKTIFISTICLTLAMPSLYMLGGKETTIIYGSENITPLPSLQEKTFIDKQFQKQFEDWWQSHFYGRKFALKLKNQIYDWENFGKIHSGYSRNVIQGKDHYLFERGYFMTCINIPQEIQKIKNLKKVLDEKGIDLYFIIAPDKVATYKDKIPERYAYFYNKSCQQSQKFEEKLVSYGINVFNAQSIMYDIREKENYEPFSVTGTHWNLYGASRTLQEAAKQFEWGSLEFSNIESKEKPYTTERDIADLLNLITPYYPHQTFYKPIFKTIKPLEGKTTIIGNSFSKEFKMVLINSGLVSSNNLLHFENKPLQESDVENILKSKRVIFVYTANAPLNREHQIYKKIDIINTSASYIFSYNFSQKSNKMEITGLSWAEHWGRWSDGKVSKFVFKELPQKNLVIEFDVKPFLWGDMIQQDVIITDKNQNELAKWSFGKGKSLPDTNLSIPANLVDDGVLELNFNYLTPISPKELGMNNDERKLGLGFSSVKVKNNNSH